MRPQQWNKYEVALLIDTYLSIKENKIEKEVGLQSLSTALRQMAINSNIEIDEIYRNISGMRWQIGFIDKAFNNDRFDNRKPPQLFIQMVEIYKNNKNEFETILGEAKKMSQEKAEENANRKDLFIAWIKQDAKLKDLSATIINCYETAFSYAQKHGLSKFFIWKIDNVKKYNSIRVNLSASKIFKFTHRSVFASFEKYGKYYADYLKENVEQPTFQPTTTPSAERREEIVKEEKIEEKIVDVENNEEIVETRAKRHRIADNQNTILFANWLLDTQKMAPASSRGYSSAVKVINEWALERGIWNKSIFELTYKEVVDNISILKANKTYIDFNTERHNQFSATLTKYIAFLADLNNDSQSQMLIDENLQNGVISVLKEHYSYGYRYDSIRELIRFRQYAEDLGLNIPESDDELKQIIISCGDVVEDKVFAKNNDMVDDLKLIISELLQNNVCVIYYESLLAVQHDFMDKYHITTEEILKEYLQKNIPNFYFSKRFMSLGEDKVTESTAVAVEMIRVWGNDATCKYEQLVEKLPYIPEANIQRILFSNPLFVWVSEGVYLYIDRFVITDEEKANIIQFVEDECLAHGFATLPEIPFGNLEVENYNLSSIAIQTSVYRMILQRDYNLNGKILTKGSSSNLDAVTIIKQEFSNRDECSFDEVAEKVIDVVGSSNRQIAFQALYDEYVRVDKNRFVAFKYFNFDVDGIDAILSKIYIDGFGAIRNVSTFAMFPICGYPWNHYVLESFCYRYSKKYKLHVINFNDKNAGIIAERDLNKTYKDMLTLFLVKADVKLEEDIVGPFLCDNGYLAKSKYGMLNEIIQKAQELREG